MMWFSSPGQRRAQGPCDLLRGVHAISPASRWLVGPTYDARGCKLGAESQPWPPGVVAGRDAQGIDSPGAKYEELCERILSEVQELCDSRCGEPLILRAYRREELYHGPYADLRPDIVLEPNDTLQIFRKTEISRPAAPVRILDKADLRRGYTTSQHLMNGILLIHGAGIRRDSRLSGVEMQDIAPTVLCAMGLPIPEWMDWQVVHDAFEPSYLAEHPVQMAGEVAQHNGQAPGSSGGYSEEEAGLIENRLRGPGYLWMPVLGPACRLACCIWPSQTFPGDQNTTNGLLTLRIPLLILPS
jgi:hypothetical protein